jgi:hypothetical protein
VVCGGSRCGDGGVAIEKIAESAIFMSAAVNTYACCMPRSSQLLPLGISFVKTGRSG